MVKRVEFSMAQSKDSTLDLKDFQVYLSGMSALRSQHGRLEREYSNSYGLDVQHNSLASQLIDKYQAFRSMSGTLRKQRSSVVDPDPRCESVRFNPKPPSNRRESGCGSSVGAAGSSTGAVGSSLQSLVLKVVLVGARVLSLIHI